MNHVTTSFARTFNNWRSPATSAAVFAVLSLLWTAPAAADARISEFSVSAGWSTISVQKAPANEFEGIKTYSLGGPSLVSGVTVYQTSRVTARLVGNIVIDLEDSAVLRYGISSSLGYYLLGGPVNHTTMHESATISSHYSYCLIALFQPSFDRYAFPDTSSKRPEPLNATVLETSVGLELTHAFYFDTSVGATVLASLKSFFVSGDKIALQSLDLLVSWHTSL